MPTCFPMKHLHSLLVPIHVAFGPVTSNMDKDIHRLSCSKRELDRSGFLVRVRKYHAPSISSLNLRLCHEVIPNKFTAYLKLILSIAHLSPGVFRPLILLLLLQRLLRFLCQPFLENSVSNPSSARDPYSGARFSLLISLALVGQGFLLVIFFAPWPQAFAWPSQGSPVPQLPVQDRCPH